VKVALDTDCLPSNISRHFDAKSVREATAINELRGLFPLLASNIAEIEVRATGNPERRDQLIIEIGECTRLTKRERLLGFNTVFDQHGGFVTSPILSDVQDDTLREELVAGGLTRRDAEQIVQAVANECDVFLTRDERTIVKPHRQWLESRFPGLRIRLPSEFLAEVKAASR
jgi:hypothetical protein